ncbi:YdeI/OmpD-associated family protein [Croceiramulus getboli]|nr:YdeI/OmpD-associated family protein [Flavobacteriaceae bacterium YJPT1-3]
MDKSEKLERFFENDSPWKQELQRLREIVRSTELEEDWKWSFPVYTWKGKNVVGLGGFKQHYGVWFFQGVYLKDEAAVLVNAQQGKTKAMRQLRFDEDHPMQPDLVSDYIAEAIANQKQGLEVKIDRKTKTVAMPEELQQALSSQKDLKEAYNQLSLSKRKEYKLYITEAKQATTKARRLEKIIPLILEGKGLNDKYK